MVKKQNPPPTPEEGQLIITRANLIALGVYEFYKDYLLEVNEYMFSWWQSGKDMKELNKALVDNATSILKEFDAARVAEMKQNKSLH